jgi:hypothetical protein
MKNISIAALVTLATLTACAKKPTAAEACTTLEATGEIKGCVAGSPAGLGAGATALSKGSLTSLPAEGCQVFQFTSAEVFDSTVKAYEGAAILAGPHRYGNRDKLIFVQCNAGLSADKGAKIKAGVDKL